MNNINNGSLTTIIIFGASGDLTQRKLIPSLFHLFRKRRTPKNMQIIGFGGTEFSYDAFREHLIQGMKKFASFKFTDEEWNQFAPNLCYISGKYTELEHFKKLSEQLKKFENEEDANRLYYMALPPSVFPTIIDNLDKSDLL